MTLETIFKKYLLQKKTKIQNNKKKAVSPTPATTTTHTVNWNVFLCVEGGKKGFPCGKVPHKSEEQSGRMKLATGSLVTDFGCGNQPEIWKQDGPGPDWEIRVKMEERMF